MPGKVNIKFKLEYDLIKIHVNAKSRDDIFKLLGTALINKGYVKPNYIEALKEREKEYPTGIQTESIGVAIPHTDAKYVNKASIAVAVLDKSVQFELMGCDDGLVDAEIIFMIAITDPNAHITVLQKLMEIFRNKNALMSIKNADEISNVIEILNSKLN